MKNILNSSLILTISVISLTTSCKNEQIEFPDYEREAVYFPIQYPVRTLILGEDRINNSIDLEHAFNVGVSIGGMYENKKDRKVDFIVDPTLLDNVLATDVLNNTIYLKQLPENYYSITPGSTITIPKGSLSGLARIQLTEAFFNDPESYKLLYVIPLRIVNSDVSILTGTPLESVTNPNPHIASDYKPLLTPKDFTMFAIKYINPWHGVFFHRGIQKENGLTTHVFHAEYLEYNETATIQTSGYKEALYNKMGTSRGTDFISKLTFSNDVNGIGDVTVSTAEGSTKIVTGSGKYYKSKTEFAAQNGSWLVNPQTGKTQPHLTITLNFTVTGITPEVTHQFLDTLVFRDNGVKFENYTVQILSE